MIRTLLLATAVLACAPAVAEPILGVRDNGEFVRFDSATPGIVTSLGVVSGLLDNDFIVAIDRRPNGGGIFALTSRRSILESATLYSIDFSGAAPVATQVGSSTFTFEPAVASRFPGFDFNPVPDRIRVVAFDDQNLRINPDDGTLTMADGTLAYDSVDTDGDPIDPNAGTDPRITAAAYTNSFAPSPRTPPPGTTLYVIDSGLEILAIQSPPNDGVLNTVGPLGIVTGNDFVSFDISGASGVAYLVAPTPITALFSDLYTVDLTTGLASLVGTIGGERLFGITVLPADVVDPVPAPAVLALFGLGLAALASRRRRG